MSTPRAAAAPPAGPAPLAVALHDIEPATFPRIAAIRVWLAARGVERVTLLVIPAHDLHAFDRRRPELVDWLLEHIDGGDAVAQHGFDHRQARPAPAGRGLLARLQGAGTAEFEGLGREEARARLLAGRRILRRAGIDPSGFVAPAYAYTPALRAELHGMFGWWAGLLGVHSPAGAVLAPAVCLGTSGPLKRRLSPAWAAAGSRLGLVRLDLHPADFDHPGHVRALDTLLRAARGRPAVTYGDLLGGC